MSTVVANPDRRDRLADAGLALLAREGARGVTYRAVERAAGLPAGTTSNTATRRPDADRVTAYMADIRDRLTRSRDLFLALLELRLEATRRPALAPLLTDVIRTNYEQDVAFHEDAGLPGGREEVRLLHFAMTGLMLELLTTPTALGVSDPAATVATLTTRLLSRPHQ
jgi:hypothetical protein